MPHRYNRGMRTLAESNPYLRDPKKRRAWLEENARESSAFEGARGLAGGQVLRPSRKRRSIASRKKSVRAS